MLLAAIESYLSHSSQALELRLIEIEHEIVAAAGESRIEALNYEREQLLALSRFSENFQNPEDLHRTIDSIIQGDHRTIALFASSLGMEAIVLLREAASTSGIQRDMGSIAASIQGAMTQLEAETTILIEEMNEKSARAIEELEKLKWESQTIPDRIHELDSQIAEIQAELQSLPQTITAYNTRLENVGRYWHCCDNMPFCHRLSNYAEFEASISWSDHEAACKRGPEFEPPAREHRPIRGDW